LDSVKKNIPYNISTHFYASTRDKVRNAKTPYLKLKQEETIFQTAKVEPVLFPKIQYSKLNEDGVRVYGESIIVQPEETLGHFADWLDLPTRKLRQLNDLSFKQNIRIGQTLRLDFSKVSSKKFEKKRMAFHTTLRDTFFNSYRVEGAVTHQMRQGETLWAVANKRFDIPLWLIMDYNGTKDPDQIFPGETLRIPVVAPVQNGS